VRVRARKAWTFVVSLLALVVFDVSPQAQNAAVTLNVDANGNRHPIDAMVYGVAHATAGAWRT
jgi:hypothetical protein